MRRYNLIDGVMVEAEDGIYVLYSDVVNVDKTAADTLTIQLNGLISQIESWHGE